VWWGEAGSDTEDVSGVALRALLWMDVGDFDWSTCDSLIASSGASPEDKMHAKED
jgi:hypothetical protein